MDKKTVIDFFDHCAPWWDADMIRNEPVIAAILDNAGVKAGLEVLDVACGTGVLFPDYFARQVKSLTAIDIAPEMARRAQEKFPQAKVLCGDVEAAEFDRLFDVIMVYNAFPHFPEPEKLVKRLAQLCKPGGRLSIAHGMSRQHILSHHESRAKGVSIDLLEETQLAKLLEPYFHVDVVISDEKMYQVCGAKK